MDINETELRSLGWMDGGPLLCGPAAEQWVDNSSGFKPPEGAEVVFRYNSGGVQYGWTTYYGGWSAGDWEISDSDVTHWAIIREPDTAR